MKSLLFLLLLASAATCTAEPEERWAKKGGIFSHAIGVDQTGNVAFTYSKVTLESTNYPLRIGKRASADGRLLWMTAHGRLLGDPSFFATAIDPKGDIIVSATYRAFRARYSFVTVTARYAGKDGALRWEQVGFDGAAPTHIVLDGHGGFNAVAFDFASNRNVIANYSMDDGSTRWITMMPASQYAFSRAKNSRLHSVTHGVGGAICVTAQPNHFRPASSIDIVRVDNDGHIVWSKNIPLAAEFNSLVFSSLDRRGDLGLVFDVLLYDQDPVYSRIYVAKMSGSTGSTLWTNLYKAPGFHSTCHATSVVSNSRGDIVVANIDYAPRRIPRSSRTILSFASRTGALSTLVRRDDVSGITKLAIDGDGSLISANLLKTGKFLNITKRDMTGEITWSRTSDRPLAEVRDIFPGLGFQVLDAFSDEGPLFIKQVDGATPETGSAFGVEATYASVRGLVGLNGFRGSGAFEMSRDPDFEDAMTTDFVSIPDDSTLHPIEASLTDLEPNTVYYYRAIANANGNTTRGIIRDFRTRSQ